MNGFGLSRKTMFRKALKVIILLALAGTASIGGDDRSAYASPDPQYAKAKEAILADPRVPLNTVLSASAKVPERLEAFARQTVNGLAEHAPFSGWNEAGLDYTPLGPGTHSWLVTLEHDDKPLGYLIITSDDEGGYVLSEYGLGTDLPYSLAPLEHVLTDGGWITPGPKGGKTLLASLPSGSRIEAMYIPAAPLWKITMEGIKPLYVHAVTNEIIPEPQKLSLNSKTAGKGFGISSAAVSLPPNLNFPAQRFWTTTEAIRTNSEGDPYSDLLWLTAPSLKVNSGSEFQTLLPANSHKALMFTAGKQNASYAAPFSLTGWQRWSSQGTAVFYVTVPHRNVDIIRYIPADHLIRSGQFRVVSNSYPSNG